MKKSKIGFSFFLNTALKGRNGKFKVYCQLTHKRFNTRIPVPNVPMMNKEEYETWEKESSEARTFFEQQVQYVLAAWNGVGNPFTDLSQKIEPPQNKPSMSLILMQRRGVPMNILMNEKLKEILFEHCAELEISCADYINHLITKDFFQKGKIGM